MADIHFQCDSCAAKLRLSNPALAGKKIKCPKCAAVTRVPVPDEPAEEEIAEAALAPPPPPRKRPESVSAAPKKAPPKAPPPDDDEDEPAPPPRQGKKSPPRDEDGDGPPRKKGKKERSRGTFSPLVIGGAAAGALAVLALVLFLAGVFDGKSPGPVTTGPPPKPDPNGPGPKPDPFDPKPIDPGPGDGGAWPLKPLDAGELATRAQLREQNRQARAAEEAKWVEARLAAGEKAPFVFGPGRKGAARSPAELRFSPAGALVALQGFQGIDVWDLTNGKLLWAKEDRDQIANVVPVFSPDGTLLVTARRGGVAEVRDARTGQVRATLKGHDGGVAAAAFSPDGKTLTTVSYGEQDPQTDVRVWDVSDPGAGKKLPPRFGVAHRLALSPDGRLLATHVSLGFATKVWDLHAGREVWSASLGHDASDLTFSPDGKYLAVGTTGDKRGPFKVIEVESGATRVQYQTPDSLGCRVAFSPDGVRLLVLHGTGQADLWDVAGGKRLREWKLPVARPVDVSPGGSLAVMVPDEWSLGIWTIDDLK